MASAYYSSEIDSSYIHGAGLELGLYLYSFHIFYSSMSQSDSSKLRNQNGLIENRIEKMRHTLPNELNFGDITEEMLHEILAEIKKQVSNNSIRAA